MKPQKPTIYFGVTDMQGTPQKITPEQKERLSEMLGDGGRYDPVFCEDDSIPKMVKSIALYPQIDKEL
jgi:hypothetical protein